MFLAELNEAIRLVLQQFLLQNLKFGVIEGTSIMLSEFLILLLSTFTFRMFLFLSAQYVIAPASAFWLFSASCFFEAQTMYDNNALDIILENPVTFVVASFLGLGVNVLSSYVIQATSSLTMKVLNYLYNKTLF